MQTHANRRIQKPKKKKQKIFRKIRRQSTIHRSTSTSTIQIYDTKCLHYIDWLIETRPSFSPPRRDLRPPGQDPGANEVYTERLDALNTKFQRLLEQLAQRLKTAIEVSGAEGLVSFLYDFYYDYLMR